MAKGHAQGALPTLRARVVLEARQAVPVAARRTPGAVQAATVTGLGRAGLPHLAADLRPALAGRVPAARCRGRARPVLVARVQASATAARAPACPVPRAVPAGPGCAPAARGLWVARAVAL
jgi:hypothetical protein